MKLRGKYWFCRVYQLLSLSSYNPGPVYGNGTTPNIARQVIKNLRDGNPAKKFD
jgi:hypothetical protein